MADRQHAWYAKAMRSRSFLLGVLLGLAGALVPSCGTQGPRCLVSNCSGCCDLNGVCQKGDQDFSCGTGAAQCSGCPKTHACLDHVCTLRGGIGDGDAGTGGGTGGGSGGGTGGGGICGGTSCNGCCDSGGRCRGGNTYNACGLGGAACVTCPAGQTCLNNACAPYACPGCVQAGGGCVAGNQNGACGSDGGTCRVCSSPLTCLNGACVAGATCGPANCNGCCNGNTCVTTGQSATNCGSSGNACSPCSGTDQCVNMVCQPAAAGGGAGGGGGSTGSCSSTCSGCCDTSGNCQAGDTSSACGVLGEACQSCLFCLGGLCF